MLGVLDIFFSECECFNLGNALVRDLEVVCILLELTVYRFKTGEELFWELVKTRKEGVKIEAIDGDQRLLALMCPALLEEFREMEHSLGSQVIDVD